MKSKKFFFIFLSVFVVAITTIIIISNINKNTINYYAATADIDTYGNVKIEETFVIDYNVWQNYRYRDVNYSKNHSKNPLFKGISSTEYNNDVSKIASGSSKIKVYRGDIINDQINAIDITDDVELDYNEECEPYSVNCDSFYANAKNAGTLTGLMTFVYEYTLEGYVTQYQDASEFNFKFFANLEYKVKKAGVTITLENPTGSFDDLYGYGHGLSEGNITQNGNKSFDFVGKNISINDEFECRVVFPNENVKDINDNHKIDVQMKEKILAYEDDLMRTTRIRYITAIIGNICTVVVGIIMIFIVVKVYKKYDKEFTPTFDKPYLRELPYNYTPAEMGYLYHFMKVNDEDLTATLLDLIRREFIIMEAEGDISDDNPNFKFRLNNEKDISELKPHETHLINWFIKDIGNGSEVTIKEIEGYGKNYTQAEKFQKSAESFKKKIIELGKTHDFFLNTTKDKTKAYGFLLLPVITLILIRLVGFFASVVFTWNTICLRAIIIVYSFYVATIKKRSVNGNEEYAQWHAFASFLTDFGTFEDYPMPGIVMWEEFLVYATTLKLADKVMEQLKVKLPEIEETGATFMSTSYYGTRRNIYVFNSINRINRSVYQTRMNSISSIAAHNSSSYRGGGHGGGFSGGSSFGGGGGGARSGR